MFTRTTRNRVFTLLLATGLTLGANMPAQADDIGGVAYSSKN